MNTSQGQSGQALARKEKTTIMATMAARFQVDESEMLATLKQTAFRGQVTDAQMTALLIVANQYGLNPWTKEIYAFPDNNNGIVPVVGVDGWSRIINENPQFDGMEYEADEKSCTCIIYRKDRNHPTKVTEYMDECKRNTGPWKSHPMRMLRHKATIQCARLAFGYVGIYDEDEAERIIEKEPPRVINPENEQVQQQPVKPGYTDDEFSQYLPQWRGLVDSGKRTADEVLATVQSKRTLTEEQINQIKGK